MNQKKEQWIVSALFCGFLFGMLVMYLFLPKKEFSQQEKRYFAEPPVLNWETVSNGKFTESVEDYLADHIPGRNFFVGLNAYYDLLTGRQTEKSVFLIGNDRIVEAPVRWNAETIEKNLGIINSFSQKTEVPLDLMIVPSAGWAAQESGEKLPLSYPDVQIIDKAYSLVNENIRTVDLVSAFRQTEEPQLLYYKTDHHWNSLGAYAAYRSYMQMKEKQYAQQEDYRIESISDFYGSTYSRSALWLTPGESLELWHSEKPILVMHEGSEEPHEGVFFRERLQESDKYTVFLDGNHSTVRLENRENAGNGKILVIRDSYSNCLGGFLADSYEEVVLVDLRYHRQPVSELLAEENFDQVLVCYSIGNFLTDTNLVWLR